jgi:hypothetical protein
MRHIATQTIVVAKAGTITIPTAKRTKMRMDTAMASVSAAKLNERCISEIPSNI